MRLGVFGGTFDPPHAGHRALCEAARDQLRLDRLEVIPCARPPHKQAPRASGEQRLKMVQMALEGLDRVFVSPRELERPAGASFTLTTLEELAAEQPEAELFLVLGADSYDDLPVWHEAARILELAHLAVAARPGSSGLDGLRPGDRERLKDPLEPAEEGRRAVYRLRMAPYPISASEIRRLLGEGRTPPPGSIAPAVATFIAQQGLYSSARSGGDEEMNSTTSAALLQSILDTLGERPAGPPVTPPLRGPGRCFA